MDLDGIICTSIFIINAVMVVFKNVCFLVNMQLKKKKTML